MDPGVNGTVIVILTTHIYNGNSLTNYGILLKTVNKFGTYNRPNLNTYTLRVIHNINGCRLNIQ